MSKQVIDYDNIVGPTLLRFLERTSILEAEAIQKQRYVDRKALDWETTVSEIRREINYCKMEIKNLNSQLINTKVLFINLVNEFKDTALEEDFRRLKNTIDDWKIDKFLTRKEFMKLLNDRVE